MKETFFELIRLSIGTGRGVSRQLSVGEWEGMYQIAVQQSLVGICMAGVIMCVISYVIPALIVG